jgi:hypothetical protein
MAKLNREARLRERRSAKQARKEARRLAGAGPDPNPARVDDGDAARTDEGDATAVDEPGNAEQSMTTTVSS